MVSDLGPVLELEGGLQLRSRRQGIGEGGSSSPVLSPQGCVQL